MSAYSPYFITGHDVTCCEIYFGSVGVSWSSSVPAQLLAHPQPTFWGLSDTLTLCEYCSTVAKTFTSSQHWFGHKSKTAILSAMRKINSITAKSSAIVDLIFFPIFWRCDHWKTTSKHFLKYCVPFLIAPKSTN